MPVRIYPGGATARIGDERYEVEWQELTAGGRKRTEADPDYEFDHDRDQGSVCRHFATLKEARAFARAVVDKGETVYGQATIERQRVELLDGPAGVGEWVAVGDPEYVD